MPEMPEVETIRRTLANKVEGRVIKDIEVRLPRLIKWPEAENFRARLINKQIISLGRKGKYLLFYVEDDAILVIHLRMTGRLQYVEPGVTYDKFTHIIFRLDNEDALLYADTRTLGTLYLIPKAELWRISGLASMGPEPLSVEFTFEYFAQLLKKRQGKIKAVLLNQQYIGGLGNIYVDESLHLARVSPQRTANSLSEEEMKALYSAVNQVIKEGLAHGGTTFRDYRDGLGKKGDHQDHLRVYGRKGEPCENCGTPISWSEVAGRGTHYCHVCQK